MKSDNAKLAKVMGRGLRSLSATVGDVRIRTLPLLLLIGPACGSTPWLWVALLIRTIRATTWDAAISRPPRATLSSALATAMR